MPQPFDWISHEIAVVREQRERRERMLNAFPRFWKPVVQALELTVQRYNAEITVGLLPQVQLDLIKEHAASVIYVASGRPAGSISGLPEDRRINWSSGKYAGVVWLDLDDDGEVYAFETHSKRLRPPSLARVLLRPILFPHNVG